MTVWDGWLVFMQESICFLYRSYGRVFQEMIVYRLGPSYTKELSGIKTTKWKSFIHWLITLVFGSMNSTIQ